MPELLDTSNISASIGDISGWLKTHPAMLYGAIAGGGLLVLYNLVKSRASSATPAEQILPGDWSGGGSYISSQLITQCPSGQHLSNGRCVDDTLSDILPLPKPTPGPGVGCNYGYNYNPATHQCELGSPPENPPPEPVIGCRPTSPPPECENGCEYGWNVLFCRWIKRNPLCSCTPSNNCSNCNAPNVCVNGECVQGSSNNNCANIQCPAGMVCDDGNCVPLGPPPRGHGQDPCDNIICGPGEHCVNGSCYPDDTGNNCGPGNENCSNPVRVPSYSGSRSTLNRATITQLQASYPVDSSWIDMQKEMSFT